MSLANREATVLHCHKQSIQAVSKLTFDAVNAGVGGAASRQLIQGWRQTVISAGYVCHSIAALCECTSLQLHCHHDLGGRVTTLSPPLFERLLIAKYKLYIVIEILIYCCFEQDDDGLVFLSNIVGLPSK